MRRSRRLEFGLLAALLLPGFAASEPIVPNGYQEAVFSVSDSAAYQEFFESVAGWQVIHKGEVDPALLSGWGLSAEASATETVIGNPGTERGFIRLIQFANVEQQQIRSNAQTWDTGGWFDANSRIVSMEKIFAEFQRRDWQAASDPVEFEFGPFVVKEWLARGPDGIVLALIERVAPPLEGWPELRSMSQLFNATQIVDDIDEASDFYLNTLGFEVYLEHSGASREAGPNVLGLPNNLATEIPRHITIVHPTGANMGSIELLEFEGADGHDYSARARPPNLGILMLRFEVNDIVAAESRLRAAGVEISMPPIRITLPPYGERYVMAFLGPGGVWLEFYSNIGQDDSSTAGGAVE